MEFQRASSHNPRVDATLTVRVPAAAQSQGCELDIEVVVDGEGEPVVQLTVRRDGDISEVLCFVPYDWERVKTMIAETDRTIEQLRVKGIVFDV
jgi:uncharacterized ParB-like nuclease family protein